MNKSDILAAAKWRSAIKQFDPDRKISDDDWQFLLEIARFSPSSYGFEQWNILDVQDPALREKLAPAIGTNVPRLDASHFVIFTIKTDMGPDSKYFRHIITDIRHESFEAQESTMDRFKNFQENQQNLTSPPPTPRLGRQASLHRHGQHDAGSRGNWHRFLPN